MGFLRRERDPARVIENQLAALHKHRADLEQHLAAATKAVDAANAERRRLLLETDALDSAAIDRAEAACVAAANRVAGTEDAARHLGEKVADAEQRLAEHRDRVEHERVAALLERRADAVDAAAAELAEALEGVADAHRALTTAVGTEGIRSASFGIEPSAANIAAQVLAAGLSTALPGLHAHSTFRQADDPEPRSADAVARELQSDHLRFLAANIREGAAPAIIPDTVSAAPRELPVRIPETTLALSEPIEWHGVDGRLVQAPEGGVTIPVPIAEAAIARGVGHLIDTPEGLAVLKEAAEPDVQPGTKNLRSVRVRRGSPWLRLDVNLWTYAEAERERLR